MEKAEHIFIYVYNQFHRKGANNFLHYLKYTTTDELGDLIVLYLQGYLVALLVLLLPSLPFHPTQVIWNKYWENSKTKATMSLVILSNVHN